MKDGLKECLICSLSKKIDTFWDFNEILISKPKFELDKIKEVIKKTYSDIEWSHEANGIHFGHVPCNKNVEHRYNVEVTIKENPFTIFMDGGCATDIKLLAEDLEMTAFDVLNGDKIFP